MLGLLLPFGSWHSAKIEAAATVVACIVQAAAIAIIAWQTREIRRQANSSAEQIKLLRDQWNDEREIRIFLDAVFVQPVKITNFYNGQNLNTEVELRVWNYGCFAFYVQSVTVDEAVFTVGQTVAAGDSIPLRLMQELLNLPSAFVAPSQIFLLSVNVRGVDGRMKHERQRLSINIVASTNPGAPGYLAWGVLLDPNGQTPTGISTIAPRRNSG